MYLQNYREKVIKQAIYPIVNSIEREDIGMFCRHCGKEVKETDSWCSYCGANLSKQRMQENEDERLEIKYENLERESVMPTMYCQECGSEISRSAKMCPKCCQPVKYTGAFSIARLVIGILSLVLSPFIIFQSFAVGVVNTIGGTGDIGGTAGVMVALLFIVCGIVGISTRNSRSKAGAFVCFALYILGGLLGIGNSAVYTDLEIWGWLAIVFAIVYLIAGVRTKKNK